MVWPWTDRPLVFWTTKLAFAALYRAADTRTFDSVLQLLTTCTKCYTVHTSVRSSERTMAELLYIFFFFNFSDQKRFPIRRWPILRQQYAHSDKNFNLNAGIKNTKKFQRKKWLKNLFLSLQQNLVPWLPVNPFLALHTNKTVGPTRGKNQLPGGWNYRF